MPSQAGEGAVPFGPGSVALAVYPHASPVREVVEDVMRQATLAESVGFDGVTLCEHHGLAEYLPNPLQVAGWVLEETEKVWAGACPVLLPLRSAALVAEEVAWLAARFPSRVCAGFAPGYADVDFEIADVPKQRRSAIFRSSLGTVVAALTGHAVGPLAADAAISATARNPVPMVATAAGPAGVRRAAEAGVGIILGPFNTLAFSREIIDTYLAAGGSGPRILIRRPWIGDDAVDRMESLGAYYRSIGANHSWMTPGHSSELIFGADPEAMGAHLADALHQSGATCARVMFNLPGATPDSTRYQIERFGNEVLPVFRERLAELGGVPGQHVAERSASR